MFNYQVIMDLSKRINRISLFVIFCLPVLSTDCTPPNQLGEFEGQTNIGIIEKAGSVRFDPVTQVYRISGGGANIGDNVDAFYFVWRRYVGDLDLAANTTWADPKGKNGRKAGWMIREGLEAEAPYVAAIVRDNMICLQYRKIAGGSTKEICAPVKVPIKIQLERNGAIFNVSVIQHQVQIHPIGSITVSLRDTVYAGLAVCSHDLRIRETAVFSEVFLKNPGVVAPGQRQLESRLETFKIESKERTIVYRARNHFEAPNWSRDGKLLLVNSQGRLYTISLTGGSPRLLNTGRATRCNNDHGWSPDGKWLALSHAPKNVSLIYVLPGNGGIPRLVTPSGPSYWHGWSPDGKTLAYCARRNNEYDIYTIPVSGGLEQRLTEAPGLDDGPDYSPDGRFIYFNSARTGLMKIWRMNPDGSNQEQVTFDEDFNDWFPHPSPDGKWLIFLSYDKSISGHPPDKDVVIRIMPSFGGTPEILTSLLGGQGTLNVPSWSPDSKYFAFVSYNWIMP